MGAWVEIFNNGFNMFNKSVAPYMGAWVEISIKSILIQRIPVAPYMGAWVEMLYISSCVKYWFVAPYMGAWVEINTQKKRIKQPCRTLYGCVSRNYHVYCRLLTFCSRTLYGCVSRNSIRWKSGTAYGVAPYMGAWVEICKFWSVTLVLSSHLIWVRE